MNLPGICELKHSVEISLKLHAKWEQAMDGFWRERPESLHNARPRDAYEGDTETESSKGAHC